MEHVECLECGMSWYGTLYLAIHQALNHVCKKTKKKGKRRG